MLRGPAANSFEIVGSGMTAAALALRTYAARQRLPHVWFDSDSVAGQAFLKTVQLSADDLPAVVTPSRVLKCATPGRLAELVGLSYVRAADKPVDLTIIGAGPAGLAAAVYGASEGLATVLIDAVGTGGQAAASSRIENYLGFPSGLSGADLTGRAAVQALKFGAELSSPCEVVKLDCAKVNCACCCPTMCRSRAGPSSSPPAPGTGRCRSTAGPTSSAPASTTPQQSSRRAAAAASRSPSSAAPTPPGRPRSTWPAAATRSPWWSAAPTSTPGCRPTWSNGCWPIRR